MEQGKKTMDDYISREALIKAVEDFRDNDPWEKKRTMWEKWRRRNYCEIALKGLAKAPAADVRPVVRGEWIAITERLRSWKYGFENVTTGYKCSVCGREERFMEPFCNCGADMRGEQE